MTNTDAKIMREALLAIAGEVNSPLRSAIDQVLHHTSLNDLARLRRMAK